MERDPGARFVVEEAEVYDLLGATQGVIGDGDVWVVDPLDGTTSFIHGYPTYSVSVALVRGLDPVAGAVYNAAAGEMNAAALGLGATRDGAPIHVTDAETRPRRARHHRLPLRPRRAARHPDGGAHRVPARARARHAPRRLGGHRLLPRGGRTRRRLLGVRAQAVGHGGGSPDLPRSRCARHRCQRTAVDGRTARTSSLRTPCFTPRCSR